MTDSEDESVCYVCEKEICYEEESTQCDRCDIRFHIKCNNLTKQAVNAQRSNKCVLIYCPECISNRDNSTEEKMKIALRLLYKLDMFNQQHMPQNTINNDSLKAIVLKLDEMEKQICSQNQHQKVSDATEQHATSFANVVKRSNIKPAVVIKPKKKQECATTLEAIKKSVNTAAVNVCGTRNVKEGAIVLQCANATETMKVKSLVSDKLGDDYEVVLPKIKNPRLRVTNIPTEIQKDSIIDELKKHNEELMNCDMSLVTVLNRKATSKQQASNDIVIEVNGTVYNKLIEMKNLRLPWRECKIFEHMYIKRCYKCLGFAHIAKECKLEQKCSKCGGAHKYSDCKSKKTSCANCCTANMKLKSKMNINHHAWSNACPVYKRRLEALANKIEYNAAD